MLETADGAELSSHGLWTHVDFDAQGAHALVERFGVLNLPTLIVLDANGAEVDRVQGYERKGEWLEQTNAALAASNPLPALETRARESPDDAAAQLELGWRLLVRGDVARGEALCERAILLDPDNAQGRAAEALFVMGRYHQRVKLDYRTGRNLWRELATRFPRAEQAMTALSWWAKAEAEMGNVALGAEVLRRAAQAPGATPDHVLLWASYAQKRGVDREAARAAAEEAVGRATGDTATELREVAAALASPPAQ